MESRLGRALVADDYPEVAQLVAGVLVSAGWEVTIVECGQAALCSDLGSFQLAVLDVSMPPGDGLAVLAAIRGRGLPTRVIVMSSETGWSTAALDGGADAFLPKPFTIATLMTLIVSSAGP